VAIFTGRLLDEQQSTINGTGTQTRDFVYVDDVVAANMAASEAEWQGQYNVGTGVETSVNELYASLASIAGNDIPAAHGPAKEGEQLRSVLDGSRLRKLAELPERTQLREGLAKTFAWLRDVGRTR
jgi:UDP-glucose 4-epimerase